MKKLIIASAFAMLCLAGHSQDTAMNKKMENRTDRMNKKMENPNDPMNKKIGDSSNALKLKVVPQRSDSLRHKTTPKTPAKKEATQ